MGRRRTRLRQAASATATILFFQVFRLLPLPLARRGARLLGRLALLLPRLRKTGMANLDLAYGDALSRGEKWAILRGAAENLVVVAAEFPHLPSLLTCDINQHADFIGVEHLPRNGGGLLIAPHSANWEWAGALLARHGFKAAVVVRPLDDVRLNALVDKTRRGSGLHTICKEDAGPEILQLLREGWQTGILVDQSPRDNAVPVTFFGQPCWATVAPVMIAVRARVPVFPISMHRRADWRYVVEVHPPLEMVRTGNLRADLLENSQRCQDVIEKIVRAHPEHWLWFHRRWKRRPRLEAEWEARRARDRPARSPKGAA